MKRKLKFVWKRFIKRFRRYRRLPNSDTYTELQRSRDFWIQQSDFWSKMYQDSLRTEKALFRRYTDLDKMYHKLVRDRMVKNEEPSPADLNSSGKQTNIDRLSDEEINRLIEEKRKVSNGKR